MLAIRDLLTNPRIIKLNPKPTSRSIVGSINRSIPGPTRQKRPIGLWSCPSIKSTSPFPIKFSYHRRSINSSSEVKVDWINDLNLRWTIPISIILGSGVWYYLKSEIDNGRGSEKFDIFRRRVKVSNEEVPPVIDLDEAQRDPVLDPSTQIGFPSQLESDLIKTNEPLRLIGLGVRTVSFLSVKVYVAGFYADPRVLRALRVVPGWDIELTRDAFLPVKKESKSVETSHDKELSPIRGEALMRQLLSVPVNFAIRISPIRPTDFTHLRDGFCRSILARINSMVKEGIVSELEAERAFESVKTFRSFFPTGVSVPRGSSLTLIRSAGSSLIVEYEGKVLGELQDGIVSKELFLAYFSDSDPISPKFKESVIDGFCNLYRKKN
ncbi:chalcone-flavanone isomerase-domain-containing protein [Phakopsora pachyrhizi]|nr:chalcone-flavanone isomerase-domain-containing protein [Phakopsora pachyrhizi]